MHLKIVPACLGDEFDDRLVKKLQTFQGNGCVFLHHCMFVLFDVQNCTVYLPPFPLVCLNFALLMETTYYLTISKLFRLHKFEKKHSEATELCF